MLKRIITLVAISFLAAFSKSSFAVKTFDCKAASQTLTKAICNDDRLSKLDDEMADVYLKVKKAIEDNTTLNGKDLLIKELRQDQNAWMTEVFAPCSNSPQSLQCANNAYSQRIERLNQQLVLIKQLQTGGSASGVVEYKPRGTKAADTAAQSSQTTAMPVKDIKTVTGSISAGGSEANGSITPEKGKRVTFLDDSPIADKIYEYCKIYDVCEVSGEIVNGHLTSISSAKLIKKHEDKTSRSAAQPAQQVQPTPSAQPVPVLGFYAKLESNFDLRITNDCIAHIGMYNNAYAGGSQPAMITSFKISDVNKTLYGKMISLQCKRKDRCGFEENKYLGKAVTTPTLIPITTATESEIKKINEAIERCINTAAQPPQPVRGEQPIIQKKVSDGYAKRVTEKMGINDPTIENVSALINNESLLGYNRNFILTEDSCGIYDKHGNRVYARLPDIYVSGVERLDTGSYCLRIYCKNNKKNCMFDYKGDAVDGRCIDSPSNHKLEAGLDFLIQHCTAVGR